MPLLLGNSFPLSLVRRRVVITPRPLADLRALATQQEVVSFWGHENTLLAARAVLGFDIAPATPRPAVTLTFEGLPMLEGRTFHEVWLVSPDYTAGFRPQIGVEVTPEHILGWQILYMDFPSET